MFFDLFLGPAILLICLVLSFLFSACETGFLSISKPLIRKIKNGGDKRADVVESLLDRKEELISGILIGNNMVNILASSLSTALSIRLFGEIGILYSTIFMTFAIILFCEILPKSYAIRHPEKVSLRFAKLMAFILKILYYVIFIIKKITLIFIRSSSNIIKLSAIEEIKNTIDFHHHKGSLFKKDKDMIDGLLDLENLSIHDAMVHRKNVVSVNIDSKIPVILSIIDKSQYSRIPVWKDESDNIIGMLDSKKFFKNLNKFNGKLSEFDVSDCIEKPWFVPETNNLKQQLYEFRKKRKKIAVVIDEYGAVQGIITIEDIIEQIVGEIRDKGEIRDEVIKLPDGSYIIEGSETITNINRILGWNLNWNDEEISTIAGLLISNAEKIPEIGEEFEIQNYLFKVLKKDENRIVKIKVKSLIETD